MTTRGLKEKEFIEIADIIIDTLQNYKNEDKLRQNKEKVLNITSNFPIYK